MTFFGRIRIRNTRYTVHTYSVQILDSYKITDLQSYYEARKKTVRKINTKNENISFSISIISSFYFSQDRAGVWPRSVVEPEIEPPGAALFDRSRSHEKRASSGSSFTAQAPALTPCLKKRNKEKYKTKMLNKINLSLSIKYSIGGAKQSTHTFLWIKQATVNWEVNYFKTFFSNKLWTTGLELELELEPEPPIWLAGAGAGPNWNGTTTTTLLTRIRFKIWVDPHYQCCGAKII